jgi:hypothetical protein
MTPSPGLGEVVRQRQSQAGELAPAFAELLFELAVSTMWSSGGLHAEEVKRGRTIANVTGLHARGGGAFSAIADGSLSFDGAPFHRLGELGELGERRLALATSLWVARANPRTDARTRRFIAAVRARLSLGEHDERALATLVSELPSATDLAFVRLIETCLSVPRAE